jgi:exopolysaccharide production protein ExoQ
LKQDMRWRTAGSKVLLVVAVFLSIIGSRPLSYWMGAGGGGPNGDGNNVNTIFFSIVIFVALVTLQARAVGWLGFVSRNKALFALYAFFAVSAFWSIDFGMSIRRLCKDFACVLVALMLLTEQNPSRACRAVFVRVAYVLFPLSVVLAKYFPDLGRAYSIAGAQMVTGVTTQKNTLGELVFVFGLILIWDLVELRNSGDWHRQAWRKYINIVMIALGVWLLIACDSKTSLVCLVLSGTVLLARGRFLRMRSGKTAMIALLVSAPVLYALDSALGVSQAVLESLGRDSTLTGRTDIWRIVLQQQSDPMLGDGFYIFWDSEKGKAVATELASLNSAHNGYIETYIDGGIVGCVFLGIFLLATGRRVLNRFFLLNRFFQDVPFAAVGLPVWIAAVIYNFSESSFLRLDTLWFTLVLVTIAHRTVDASAPSTVVALEIDAPALEEGALAKSASFSLSFNRR